MACKGPDDPISARLPVPCFGRRFEAPKARFLGAELSFWGQGPPFLGAGAPFFGQEPLFGGQRRHGGLPKGAFALEKGAPAVFYAFFEAKAPWGLAQDALALKTELSVWAPRGRTIKRSRKGLSTQPNAGRIHGFPGNFPTGVYGIEATVGFSVHFWRFFGLARGLFWRPRARKVAEKATFCAYGRSSGPSVEIAV